MQHHTNRSGTVLNAVIGLLGIGGLALTGCTSQLVQDLDATSWMSITRNRTMITRRSS